MKFLLKFFVLWCYLFLSATWGYAGSISGMVTNSKGNPLSGIEVVALQWNGFWLDFASYDTTDENGNYHLSDLTTTNYYLRFYDPEEKHLDEGYHNERPYDYDSIVNKTAVPVIAGQITSNINEQLEETGQITGLITDIYNNPIGNISVQTYKWVENGFSSGNMINSFKSDNSGHYVRGGLEEGNYYLQFYDSTEEYFTKCYPNEMPCVWDDINNKNFVTVKAGQSTNNINVQLESRGRITGKVTDKQGNPLSGIFIEALIKKPSGGYEHVRSANTGNAGYYSLVGLDSNDYFIVFIDKRGSYSAKRFDNSVSLLLGETINNINATLEIGGKITGLLENQRGEPIKHGTVSAYSWDGNSMFYVKSGHCDPKTGEYIIQGLANGDYYLFFTDRNGAYAGEGYPDEVPSNYSSPGNKTAVTVVAGQTTSGINAQLGNKGQIFGQVTDIDGNPLENINVEVFWGIPGTYGAKEGVRNRDDITGVNGYYLIEGLYDGFYYLTFSDASHTYTSKAYPNEAPIIRGRLGNKNTIGVNIGEVSRADVQLEIGGEITGQVTDNQGTPLNNISVTPLIWNGIDFDYQNNSVETDDSGIYRITGLANGNYYLRFWDNQGKHAHMGYPNELPIDREKIAQKKPITVVAGEVTENINIQMSLEEATGTITGQITDEQGQIISSDLVSISVDALIWQGNAFKVVDGSYTRVEDNGSYTISNLPAGEYYLHFSSDGFAYHSELYGNVPFNEKSKDGAKSVVVAAGQTITDIDARLLRTGTIEGQVTNQEGEGIASYIRIIVYEWDGKKLIPVRYSSTGIDGKYSIRGFENKNYYLVFEDTENHYVKTAYPDQVYIDLNRIDDKLAVTAKSGKVVSGIDIQMKTGPVIRGIVSDLSGTALSDISVIAYAREGGRFIEKRQVTTKNNGRYTLDGLALSYYYLKFYDNNKLFASQGYPNEIPYDAIEIGSKTAIELVTENDIDNINIQLNRRGKLSGTVTDSQGTALENIQVNTCLWKSTQFQCDNPTYTGQSGNYLINNMEPGDYFIKFSDRQESQYLEAGYPMESPFDWLSSEGKNTVKVLSEQTTTGIDIQMEQAGSISGQVIDQSNTAISDILVRACVWELEGFRCLKTTSTDSNGEYSVKGLGSGQYYIVFEYADDGVNINSYVVTQTYGEELPFNWQTTYDKAVVELVSGDKVVDIDIQMVNGGNITGQVTDKELFAIKDLAVSACVWNNGNFACSEETLTDEYGNYRLGPLKPGSYYIRVSDPTGLYYETGYPNEMPFLSTQIGTKQQVTVNSGEITSANNLQLELAPNLVIAGLRDNMAISEDGDTIEVDIALATQPIGQVELSISSGNSLEGRVSPAELIFTSANWSSSQAIQVSGIDDFSVDGDQLFYISMQTSSVNDASYNSLPIKQIPVINRDNELIDKTLFVEQNGVEIDTLVLSNIIEPVESVVNSRIKIEGGEYSINHGDWSSEESSIYIGDIVMVRHQSASDYGTVRETILTIGDTDYTFTSITQSH